MTSKDVNMDENDIYDVDYDELALGPSKRRRRGPGSFSFSFTSVSSNVEPEAAVLHCLSPGCCSCNSDAPMADKPLISTATYRYQCRVPGAKTRHSQACMDKSLGRALTFCHRYGAEIQLCSAYGEGNSSTGFPGAVDRDKYKKWICKNDLYEFRISKHHQANSRISFLDRLRAAQSASACTSSQCSET